MENNEDSLMDEMALHTDRKKPYMRILKEDAAKLDRELLLKKHQRSIEGHLRNLVVVFLVMSACILLLSASLYESNKTNSGLVDENITLHRDIRNVSETAHELVDELDSTLEQEKVHLALLDENSKTISAQKSRIERLQRNLRALCATFTDEKPVQCRPAVKKPVAKNKPASTTFRISDPLTGK